METAKLTVSILAVILALASFAVAQRSAAKARRAEDVRNLLGEKETVSFGALKLLRDGLPRQGEARKLLVAAVMQACVFEGSDRARALLYRVIDEHRTSDGTEFWREYQVVEKTFDSMKVYDFSKEELDLKNGRLRLGAVKKVLEGSPTTDPEDEAYGSNGRSAPTSP